MENGILWKKARQFNKETGVWKEAFETLGEELVSRPLTILFLTFTDSQLIIQFGGAISYQRRPLTSPPHTSTRSNRDTGNQDPHAIYKQNSNGLTLVTQVYNGLDQIRGMED
jgi:hypothetical protein